MTPPSVCGRCWRKVWMKIWPTWQGGTLLWHDEQGRASCGSPAKFHNPSVQESSLRGTLR
jgi:hypothetical protein